MTNAIDANGNAVTYQSNLADDNEFRATGRSETAEDVAKGHLKFATTYITDEVANNNPDVVKRQGSRVHAGGDYQPTDIIMINGMEVTYEIAQSLGLIQGSEFTSPQEVFQADAENTREAEPEDTRPDNTKLFEAQIELAFGEQAQEVVQLLTDDIVANGELSEHGIAFLQNRMGMSESAARQNFADMQETGGQVLANYLEVGDGLGMERINFLVDLAESGTVEQKAIVRNIWFQAATGKLTRKDAADAFDYLRNPYEG